MQWRRKRRVLSVIGSARHTLLLRHVRLVHSRSLSDTQPLLLLTGTDDESGLSLETAPPTTDLHRNITFNEGEYTVVQYS